MAGMGSMGGTAMSGSNSSSMTRMSSSASNMSADMSSSPGMSDVLRIQLEMIEIENNITTLLSDIAAEKAKFNALLNRPVEIEVVIPDSIVKVPFIFDERVSINEIERGNPMLGMFEEEELAYRAKNEMDKKMSYPMLGLGLQYMLIGENKTASMDSGMKPEMSGMDMIMPMFSISIPIYRNKYKAQQRENRFMWESARENYNNTLNMLQSELFKLKHELDNADRKITLYQKQAQLARVAYQLVVQEFVTAKSDLTNVIQVQRQLLDYQLRNAEAIAEYNMKVASIRKLGSFNTSNN
jgi:outer membrane protein TolC